MTLIEFFVGKHVRSPRKDHVAYHDPDSGNITYTELFRAAGAFAELLSNSGLAAQTRGLVLADDSVATVVAILGLWWHGCSAVPVNPALSNKEVEFIATDSRVEFVYIDVPDGRRSELTPVLPPTPAVDGHSVRQLLLRLRGQEAADLPPEAPWQPDQEVLLQYTSGSTGVPKGVPHRVAALLSVAENFGRVAALTPDDIVLSTAKLSFAYGFGNSLMLPLSAGASAALIRGGVDAQIVAHAIRRYRPTVLFSVPRIYTRLPELFDEGEETNLRLAVSAGEALPAELSELVMNHFGVPLVNGLGTTEALYIVLSTSPTEPAPGTIGVAAPGVSATIRDQAGHIMTDDDAEGRLHVCCPSVSRGYLDRPEATRESFADGGVFTGDIVRRRPDGLIEYVARADDFMNLGGYKIAPVEIETVIRGVNGVRDCAVVATTDSHGLQEAVAFVVSDTGSEAETIRRAVSAALRSNLSSFKRPSRIEMVATLPTTWTGKLARNELRAAKAG